MESVFLGFPGTYKKPTLPMPDNAYFEMLVLHEFGHLAGLDHEQLRLSPQNQDLNCARTMDAYESLMSDLAAAEEPALPKRKAYAAYDPNSVMSYCYWDVLTQTTGTKFTLDRRLGPNYHYQSNPSGEFSAQAIRLQDPTLYRATKIDENRTRYVIRLGLSLGDIHTLRCHHGFYSAAEFQAKCHPHYRPWKMANPNLRH